MLKKQGDLGGRWDAAFQAQGAARAEPRANSNGTEERRKAGSTATAWLGLVQKGIKMLGEGFLIIGHLEVDIQKQTAFLKRKTTVQ